MIETTTGEQGSQRRGPTPRWARRGGAALTLACVLLAPAAAGAQVRVDSKGPALNPITARDWLRHPHRDRYYQESWTAILGAADGHVVYVSFLYTNLGVVKGSTAVNVSLTRPGQMATAHRFDHKVGDYSEDAASGRIAVGPNSMTLRGKQIHIQMNEPGFSLDLKGEGWMTGAKLHSGRVYIGEGNKRWVETYVHLPRASFEGTLTVDGKRLELSADGYVDHMVQNVLPTDYSSRWWTLRLFAPQHTVAFLVYQTPKDLGSARSVVLLATDRKRLVAFDGAMELEELSTRPGPKGVHRYADRIRFAGEGKGWALEGTLASQRLHDRDAVLERLSWVERKVAGLVAGGKPVIYRWLATPDVSLTVGGGAPVKIGGVALVENLVLREE